MPWNTFTARGSPSGAVDRPITICFLPRLRSQSYVKRDGFGAAIYVRAWMIQQIEQEGYWTLVQCSEFTLGDGVDVALTHAIPSLAGATDAAPGSPIEARAANRHTAGNEMITIRGNATVTMSSAL
jgi:hypothetical protein